MSGFDQARLKRVTECRSKRDASYSMLDFAPTSYSAFCLQCCALLKKLETTLYDCCPFPVATFNARQPGHPNRHRPDRRDRAGPAVTRGRARHWLYRQGVCHGP
ncbi:hypothetical protein METHPM2_1430014 [Pseudomonas sp. PM2]